MESIKKILVLVNPSSSENRGRRVWEQVQPRFEALFSSYQYEILETTSSEHNIELGATTDADLIISVSGDGTVHDIAQGIMRRPREDRPALTMLPIGSGNDFARTLGIPFEPERALEAICNGRVVPIDVGRCNEFYFLETLSFGIDAAIAIGTYEKRKTTKSRGFALYLKVAIEAIIKELRKHRFTYSVDGGPPQENDFIIFAIQNGPTYGGGFQVAPSALANDGLLNVCVATNTSKLYALYAMSKMAKGKHEQLGIVHTFTARRITIDIAEEVPVQFDGEALRGTHFEIEVLPGALDVLAAEGALLGGVVEDRNA